MTSSGTDIFDSTLDILAARWGSAGPLLPGFSCLARGRPVSVEEIARAEELAAGRAPRHVVDLSELRQATERFHTAIWSALET